MQPSTESQIEEFNRKQAQYKLANTVIMVDPQGIIRELVSGPDKDGLTGHSMGIDVLRYHEGKVGVRAWAAKKGWTVLRDRCAADGQPEVFEHHMQVVNARNEGHPIEYNINDILPKSVIAQRALGHAEVEPLKFILGRGLVPAAEVEESEAAKKARIAKLVSFEDKGGAG